MWRSLTFIIALFVLGLSARPAAAAINDFTGTWVNTDSDTRGVTRVVVTRVTNAVNVQAFGSCTPSDCDWGTVQAEVYGPSVSDNAFAKAEALTAVFNSGFSETTVVLIKESGQLKGKFLTRFTDGSGRSSYVNTETFQKQAAGGLSGIIPKLAGVFKAAPKQDCVGFDNATIEVKKVGASWRIVDGSHSLLDFGANEAEASKSLETIKAYGFTQHCFVGRPDPSFDYWLQGNAAASGDGGEDCIGFSNANVEVKQVGGNWKIVDGSHLMFDFGANKAEAEDALKIIKYFGFTKTCYVGRPDPSLTYLLK